MLATYVCQMQQRPEYDLVIIGAGITGLCAALYAQVQRQAGSAKPRVLVLESSDRPGGKIRTEFVSTVSGEKFLLEWAADSMLSSKPEGLELARELHIESELIETNRDRQIFMMRRGRLVAMPAGLHLVIPKRIWPFLTSPLFSLKAKFMMGLDLIKPRRVSEHDESIAQFIHRRLGAEAVELLAEPILSGIYSADPNRQSIRSTFPQLVQLENRYRSLILGALRSPSPMSIGQNRGSLFVSFQNGMQTLIDALVAKLSGQIRLNAVCKAVLREAQGKFAIALENGEMIYASKVIVTTPATASAKLLGEMAPLSAQILSQMRHTSSGCVYFAYKKEHVGRALSGYGILIPKSEVRQLNAVTWTSSKLEGRAPKDHVLMRAFFGGERRPELMSLSDEEIVSIAEREMRDMHQIISAPLFTRVFRSMNGNPQYDVGHLERIAQIERELPKGLVVTGAGMRGVGIPDCIRQAKKAIGDLYHENSNLQR